MFPVSLLPMSPVHTSRRTKSLHGGFEGSGIADLVSHNQRLTLRVANWEDLLNFVA